MKNRTLTWLMIMVTLAMVACAPVADEQPEAIRLEGTNWVLQTLNGQFPLIGTTLTAAFSAGEITGTGGCNSYFGSYVLDGSRITFDAIGSTAMACLDPEGAMAQEMAYLNALQAVATVRLTDGQLEMLDESGEVILGFERPENVVENPVDLIGSEWALVAFLEGETATSAVNGTSITLQFSEGQVAGSAGCNSYGGSYTLQGDTITIGMLAQTEMYCMGEGIMEQESRYLGILGSATLFQRDANQLTLSTSDGRGLMFAVPTETATPSASAAPLDPVAAIMAAQQPRLHGMYLSPDGAWRAEIVIYDCVQVGEGDTMAYEQLRLISESDGEEQVIADQLQSCGGLGAFGLDGLFWSANSRYFYYTDAREGVPDGCGYWERPLTRVDVTDYSRTIIGGSALSSDRTRIAAWQEQMLVIWDVEGDEVARFPALVPAAEIGPVAWAPNDEALVYLQCASFCPLSGASYVVRVDLAEDDQELLLESEAPTFGDVHWDTPQSLQLFDENGAAWRYDLDTQALEAAPF